MPVASLEELWSSYLQDLGTISAACLSESRSEEVQRIRQAKGTLVQLVQLGNRLAAEFHQPATSLTKVHPCRVALPRHRAGALI